MTNHVHTSHQECHQLLLSSPQVEKDFRICNWITTNRATIVALPFTSFMSHLRKNSLHPDWEDHVHNKILKSHLEPSKESFWAWSQNVIKLNCLLRDTTSLFDDTTLHDQLDAHLNDKLKDHVKLSEAKKEKTLKSWVDAVRHLDETCISENNCHLKFIEESLNKCQSTRRMTPMLYAIKPTAPITPLCPQRPTPPMFHFLSYSTLDALS